MDDVPDIGDIVVVLQGTAYGWGRVIAVDPDNEKIVLVSWETIGLKKHSRSNLQVVDITSDMSKAYIEFVYYGSTRYH